MPPQPPLSWDAFLAETSRYSPEAFGIAELKTLVSRLEVTSDLVTPYIHFSDGNYTRHLICKNALFEAIVLCWSGDQATSIHNHGESFGVMTVCEGELDEEIYCREPAVACTHRQSFGPGGLAVAPKGLIHRLVNRPGQRTVSLHFYAGPLDEMEIFDPVAGKVETRSMRDYRGGEMAPAPLAEGRARE